MTVPIEHGLDAEGGTTNLPIPTEEQDQVVHPIPRLREQNPSALLTVGMRVRLTFASESNQRVYEARIVGWKTGAYLIIDLPTLNQELPDVVPQGPCMVRHPFAGKLVVYHCDVRTVQYAPEPLMFLTFPTHVDWVLLRKYPRIPLREQARLRVIDRTRSCSETANPECLSAVIDDLSAAGCRLILNDSGMPLAVGAWVHIEFELPGLGKISDLTARLKYIQAEPQRTIAGLEFTFQQSEFIEFRGWGATVKRAIEQFVAVRHDVEEDLEAEP